MNVKELINIIKEVAKNQPNVESVYDGDVYDNWNAAETKYASVNIGFDSATYEGQSITYSMVLYYGDRLLQNGKNTNELYSDGIRVLQSIINQLSNDYDINVPDLIVYTPFQQQFFDHLAGVYASVELTVDSELGLCGIDDFDDEEVIDKDYLKFTALENNSFLRLIQLGSNQTVDYSYNGKTWETMVNGRTLSLQSGECVYLRGILSETPDQYDSTLFQNGGRMKLSGNINAIWDYTAEDLEAGFQLKEWCGRQMFHLCREIVDISELKMPSENLAWGCYAEMFGYNRNITVAPELPATTLYGYCYSQMFYSCSSLQEIKCMAMNTMEYGEIPCTDYWLDGVAATGTFTKNANMTQWGTGADGIPEGWTIQNQSGQDTIIE